MIKLNKETKKELSEWLNSKNIALEGNIVKLFDADGDVEFEKYLKTCSEKDKDNRRLCERERDKQKLLPI